MADEPAGEQNTDTDWRQHLPEEMREAPVFQDVPDIGTLAKNYQELKSYQGNSLRIPGEDAGEEALQEFYGKLNEKVPGLMPAPDPENEEVLEGLYTRLGRPEAADGYKLPEVDTGGIDMDMSMAEILKPIAHKYGLSQKQFQGIVAEVTATNANSAQELSRQHAMDIDALSKEWGAAYTERVGKATRVAEATGAPSELVNAVKQGVVGAQTLKWLYTLSESLGGETANMVNQKGAGILTPEEAMLKISEIRGNKEHPYWKTSDPSHEAARKKMRELHKLAYPGGTSGLPQQGINAGTGGITYQ